MLPREVLFTLSIISLTVFQGAGYKCDRKPSDLIETELSKTNNGKYLLEIEGKPELYVPNEKYQIIVKLDTYVYSKAANKFKKHLIMLESKATPDDGEDVTYQTGKFELSEDMLSKFSDTCKDTVVEANTLPKKQVKLFWRAPPANSGCVSIKATVIETREKWYADDDSATSGYLTKTLCEDLNDNEDLLPEILNFCCACDEAKYEMAFQGNWIRNTHPKAFPEDAWTTKFSDIIGASHKNNQAFWEDDAPPGDGVKELAFNGSTRKLESELMENIANLRTIIKARGLAYPNITSSSYAIFRVDNENHLVSVVTKMIPSPDWIVGVSNMELCLSNCSWKQFRTINLYPRDVGIDDALEYTGNEPSTKEAKITQITSSNPADERSPFYDQSGEKMKPIAKLHFKLEKVYRKECDPDREPPKEGEEEQTEPWEPLKPQEELEQTEPHSYTPQQGSNRPYLLGCETIGWSKWSSCSVQCGKGHMTRNVRFKHNVEPGQCLDIVREETQECEEQCSSGEDEMHICPNIIWGPWSPCNETCGKGWKQRFRIPSEMEDDDEEDQECANREVVDCYEQDC